MLINTTLKTVGSLLGIGSTTPAASATGRAATPPGPRAAASPPQTAAAAPLPPLGEAARFDISPEGLQAAQQPAAVAAGAAAAASAAVASAAAATAPSPAATSALRSAGETLAEVAAPRRAAARPAAPVLDDEAAARAWANAPGPPTRPWTPPVRPTRLPNARPLPSPDPGFPRDAGCRQAAALAVCRPPRFRPPAGASNPFPCAAFSAMARQSVTCGQPPAACKG